MLQDIFILGATGGVGRALVTQIFEKGDCNSGIHKNPTRIVGLASRKKFLFKSTGISEEHAKEFVKRKSGEPFDSLDTLSALPNGDYIDNDLQRLTFIDATNGGEDMLDFYLHVAEKTPYGIVTANKIPLEICDFERFKKLTREPRRFGYRCSVMAGSDVIPKIRDLQDLGDQIIGIEGCLSGTLGYVSSELEKGRKFSRIVAEARKKGYSEPDPREDLNGFDVLKKILILARTSGYDVSPMNMEISPFIHKKHLSSQISVEEFMRSLTSLDSDLANRVEDLKNEAHVLRYIAKFSVAEGEPRINVGLFETSKVSPLGMLKGTLNKVIIKTKTYDHYSIEAPGAGLDITAQNIRRDLLYQIPGRVIANH